MNPPSPLASSTSSSDNTIGKLMEPAVAVMPPDATVGATIDAIREWAKSSFITYVYVIEDGTRRLIGVIAMRDLLLATREQKLGDIMLRDPFALRDETPLLDAMRLVVKKHFPCYPVCDAAGALAGIIWGHKLFASEAIEISAQSGKMVGVDKEERFSTPLLKSFTFRHPWLQVNMLTNFLSVAVVAYFAATINKYVALAAFLPVLMSQAANTGCQSLAVTLRGMTLGDLGKGTTGTLVTRESWLGLVNGVLTGITAALGMLIYGWLRHDPATGMLTLATLISMTGCCVISGQAGALTPIILKRCGADPATASSIFMTTITDTVSMGLFLWLAAVLLGD